MKGREGGCKRALHPKETASTGALREMSGNDSNEMASTSPDRGNETRQRMVPEEVGETGSGQTKAMVKSVAIILRAMINHQGFEARKLQDKMCL